jgi:hypothetical protein
MNTFREMFTRLLAAPGQSRAAKTVEVFGWLILIEGVFMLFVPHFVASVLHLPPLSEQAVNFFRLVGLLVSGVGMLYVVSGRLSAEGFVFASARPAARPPAMLVMWHFGVTFPPRSRSLFQSRILGVFSGRLPPGADKTSRHPHEAWQTPPNFKR